MAGFRAIIEQAFEVTLRVYLQSVLSCSASSAWDEVQKSSLLCYVAWPLVTFRSDHGQDLPQQWQPGTTISIRARLFGIIPIGTHVLEFERIDHDQRELQTREHDRLIHKWDHLIRIRQETENTSLYSDDIQIDAGILTIPVFLFAQFFYRHRQRRWRKVARSLGV